jgi:hypothetical protein
MKKCSSASSRPTARFIWFVITLPLIFSLSSEAGAAQLVSAREAQVTLPSGGNGDSVAPQITPDGRFVLFTSSASDLVTNRNGLFALNVFLRDRSSNTTALVSVNLNGTAGGNGSSMYGMVSTNGRYVLFQSDATDLVPGDTNAATDIFLRDMVSGTTTLIGLAANGADPVMTPDGRHIAFISTVTNLIANDTNGIPDVFVRDTLSNTTKLVSVGATGTGASMESPAITSDGRYVAFASSARGLVSGVSTTARFEIYLRDLVSNTTKWVSSNASTTVSNFFHYNSGNYPQSYHPVLSDDGRFVAFKTGATNGAVASPYAAWVFEYDSASDSTTVVSTNGFPRWYQVSDDVYGPEMTPDGRFIAYVATNTPQRTMSVNLWDAQTGTNILVSAAVDGNYPTNSISYAPSVSTDGRFVVFLSTAANLVSNTIASGVHIYLRDVQAGTTQLIDVDANNTGLTDEVGTVPNMTPDGSLISFSSRDSGLVAQDSNNALDVFVRNFTSGTTELVSQWTITPQTGNALSSLGSFTLSADGRWLAFASYASDLVTNDFNNSGDVFVTDLLTGNHILGSVGTDGNAALGGSSFSPTISANGRYVAFVSMATNLVANDTNNAMDIFRRDSQVGTTIKVNINGFTSTPGDCASPVISGDGRYVAFLGKTNFSTTYPSTFWCDTLGGTTMIVSKVSTNTLSISTDGQRLAYFDSASHFYVWDALLATNIYTNTANVNFASLSPNGTRVLLTTAGNPAVLTILDLTSNSNLISITNRISVPMPRQSAAPWSADGRFVTFVISTNLIPSDNNNTNDIFLCDVQTGTLTLISVNSNATASANAPSDWPVVSGDGRFVAYRSFATDIIPGITNVPSLYVFDRAFGSNSLLATGSSGSWSSWISQPLVNSNGTAVAFQSWDSGLVTGDLNRASDIFAQSQNVLIADTDVDGIPDSWTTKYFGHATGQGSDLSRATDDADGDGMSNSQEYIAGTDPTDPASVFQLQIFANASPTQGPIVSWPAAAGRSYQLQFKTNLADSLWMNVPGNVFVLGSVGYFTAPNSNLQQSGYYRILVSNN